MILPWLEAPLRHALATQRGHAVLLAGAEGIGQFELAMAMAQAWLCEAPDEPGADEGARLRPCGRCASCALVQAHTHPDLLVLVPEALAETLGWGGAGEAAERKASKAKPSKDIKVDALRTAIEFAQQTSSRGRAKVVVLHPAERMNTVSANTLLKTLEEPPGQARFLLGCGAVDALLPTIRSRCQLVLLPLPPEPLVLPWLAQQGVAAPEALLAAAGQQPLVALQMHQAGIDARVWAQLPGQLARGQGGALSGWPVPQVVDTLHKLCHDALCRAVGAAPRYFPEAALQGLGTDVRALTDWSAALRRVARHDEHPWNPGLMLESLVAQAKRALHFAG